MKKKEDDEEDYYDEDDEDSDDIAAMRARRGLTISSTVKNPEEIKVEEEENLVANLIFSFDSNLFLSEKDKLFYEEFILNQSDYIIEVRNILKEIFKFLQ